MCLSRNRSHIFKFFAPLPILFFLWGNTFSSIRLLDLLHFFLTAITPGLEMETLNKENLPLDKNRVCTPFNQENRIQARRALSPSYYELL